MAFLCALACARTHLSLETERTAKWLRNALSSLYLYCLIWYTMIQNDIFTVSTRPQICDYPLQLDSIADSRCDAEKRLNSTYWIAHQSWNNSMWLFWLKCVRPETIKTCGLEKCKYWTRAIVHIFCCCKNEIANRVNCCELPMKKSAQLVHCVRFLIVILCIQWINIPQNYNNNSNNHNKVKKNVSSPLAKIAKARNFIQLQAEKKEIKSFFLEKQTKKPQLYTYNKWPKEIIKSIEVQIIWSILLKRVMI